MQKNAKFLCGGGTAPSPYPSHSEEGDTPFHTPRTPRRLDLNPSHSEILPTLVSSLLAMPSMSSVISVIYYQMQNFSVEGAQQSVIFTVKIFN